jgi:RimJ/RimL family protein N-acetyltransferase
MLPIDTERLRLRRLEPRDAARLAEYRSEPSVAVYQSWSGMTLEEADAFIAEQLDSPIGQQDQWFQLAIAEKTEDLLMGDVGICINSLGNTAEIGFSLAPAAWGQGYGTEACRAAIDLVFSFPSVDLLEAVIDARNTSAIALVKRLGMELDRTEAATFKGEPCTEHYFVCRRGPSTG